MSLTVTLNVFSGRPNPTWTVPEGAAAELSERLSKLTSTLNLKPAGGVSTLGYRGFSVRSGDAQSATFIHGGAVDLGQFSPTLLAKDREIEKWLLSTAGSAVPDNVKAHVKSSLKAKLIDSLQTWHAPKATCPKCVAVDAPAYNPGAWNIPAVQPYNNCYNYANNRITNTFAQPGRATGHMYTQLNTCTGAGGVQLGAISDGLAACANFTAPLTVGQGFYVALVLWPGTDFHWYRQDKVGCWSHKPGSTPVTNLDNAGNPITDPRTANRGGYTTFCSYMITKASVHIN
ncbi:MAG: hypothetical protein NTV51_08075 [Verrucomicrobia bacterium]|nr:hypothetical protein [Verrucomicrobiota bacterium]